MGFKVIIVGGSVSGLSLANMLEKFSIEYILLEAHPTIAPQLGASMGLLPGGLRILDQLGCYDRVREIVGDCCYYQPSLRLFNGKILNKKKPKSFSEQLEDRTGYPQIFIDRQMFLQILFDNIQSKDRVMTRKRVVCVETAENHVCVHTQDGCTYTGDIVVGADGVHSAVRKEMWRNGVESDPGSFWLDEDKALAADSKSIFGISKRPKSLPTSALQINSFFDGRNYMMLSAPGDRLYWFMFQDMSRTTGSEIPRFTIEDESNLARKHFDDQVTACTTFGDVYENRLKTALVSLEEHVFARWYFRRIITIGDAAHKVHPNTAQGGNGAIETSAVLLNTLLRRLDDTSKLSEQDIEDVFAEVQTKRFARAANALEQGRHTSSISTRDTFASRFFVHYLLP
ncbi:FAD binding domain protein [Fusarium tjaetaba]|uniref:FAD binding domain protein n=1 Tax=Fusarium tjaetaba TaxID=1567544 RepID=A0A8H5R7R9_9HYPO|nr:FAD binding domain protein [Fusarium tjaetaba]KAF5628110.1 FAD binding domain protein [Fusarium tjaetaba]